MNFSQSRILQPLRSLLGSNPTDIGGSLPTLTLKNEKCRDIQVADLANEQGVVLFLVPKADTGMLLVFLVFRISLTPGRVWNTAGRTNRACAYRDAYSDCSSLNFNLYCLSADTSTAWAKWQTKACSLV
jgi:peroxiredoxin Q/BCP